MKIKKLKDFIVSIVILIVIAVLIITGCSLFNRGAVLEEAGGQGEPVEEKTEEKGEPETETPSTNIDKSQEIENGFKLIEKTVKNIEAIFNFINENIADSNPELASNMIYTVIKLCEDYKSTIGDKFSDPEVTGTIYALSTTAVEEGELNLEALKDIGSEKVRDIVEEAIDKKYKILMIEGMIEPVIDYQAYDEYMQYLSPEMKDYLDIKIDESEKPALMDAAITISMKDFIQRILKSMEYLENYPDSPRYNEIEQFKDWRIWVYLGGIDNSPVFDSNGKIIPDKLSGFRDALTKYPDTGLAEILASYLELLEQEDYTRTERVRDFLEDICRI